MSTAKILSPARSQGLPTIEEPSPARRRSRRTRSVCSATSNTSQRLTAIIQDSFQMSPLPSRMSVLNDNTDIQIPVRQSWWKRLGNNSRDVTEIMEEKKNEAIITNVAEELDVEILSQEKENMSVDLPDSSDGESIHSIVIPQRKLFKNQDNRPEKKCKETIIRNKKMVNMQKSYFDQTNIDKDINVMPKKLFNQAPKTRTKPVFTAALLSASANKTVNANTSIEKPTQDVQGQSRNLFGNRPTTKRKNVYAQFLLSDSDDDIPDIQPRVFGFQKKTDHLQTLKQQGRSSSRSSVHSTASNMTDVEIDDWQHLPSSTMVEHQFEEAGDTSLKRRKLSRLSRPRESDIASNKNNSINKSMRSNSKIIHPESEEMNIINTRSQSFNKSKNNGETSLKITNLSQLSRPRETDIASNKNNSINKSMSSNSKIIHPESEEMNIINTHSQSFNKSKNNGETSLKITNLSQLSRPSESDIALNKNNSINKSSSNSKIIHPESEEMNIINTDAQSFKKSNNNSNINNNKSLIETSKKNGSKLTQEVSMDKTLAEEIMQEDVTNEEHEKTLTEKNQPADEADDENFTLEYENDDEQMFDTNVKNCVLNHNVPNKDEFNNVDPSKNLQTSNNAHIGLEITGKQSENLEINSNQKSIQNVSQTKLNDIYEEVNQDMGTNNENDQKKSDTKQQSRDITHDTGRLKNEEVLKSPEAVLHNKSNRGESFTTRGRHTSISKSKTIIKDLSIRPSLEPARESTGLIDGTVNSSAEGSGWDSHRTTRKTLRQTFGKDFTPRKSLRTLVMERAAKRQTNNNQNDQIVDNRKSNFNEATDKSKHISKIQSSFNEVADKSKVDAVADTPKHQSSFNEVANKSKDKSTSLTSLHAAANHSKRETYFGDITNKRPMANSTELPDFESNQENNEEHQDDQELEQHEEVELDHDSDQNEEVESDQRQEQIGEGESDQEQDQTGEVELDQETEQNTDLESDQEAEQNKEVESDQEAEQNEVVESDQEAEQNEVVESDQEAEQNEEVESEQETESNEEVESEQEAEPNEEVQSDQEPEQDEENQSDQVPEHNEEDQSNQELEQNEENELDQESEQNPEMESDEEIEQNAEVASDQEAEQTEELESDQELEQNEESQSDKEQSEEFESYREPEPLDEDDTAEESVHKVSNQLNSEMFWQKLIQENEERRRKVQEKVMNSLKVGREPYNPFKMPEVPKQKRASKAIKTATKPKLKPSLFVTELPPEFYEDLKYKPPKRFQGKNAPWITKRLYKFLEDKLRPKYDYHARVRAEKLVEKLYVFVKEARKCVRAAPPHAISGLKREMARLGVVHTHYEFYRFFHEFMPREVRIRVNPDILNKIPRPKSVFSNILDEEEED